MKDIANGLLEFPRLLFGALRWFGHWLGTLPGRIALAAVVVAVCGWAYWSVLASSPPMSGGTIMAGAIVVGGALAVWAILGGDED